jgi:hypothetical protein
MFTCAVLFALATPAAPNADYLAMIHNAQHPKYETRVSSNVTSSQITNLKLWDVQMANEFKPKTEFVKKLLAFREQAILNGMKLLTVDEILTEKHAFRGEID